VVHGIGAELGPSVAQEVGILVGYGSHVGLGPGAAQGAGVIVVHGTVVGLGPSAAWQSGAVVLQACGVRIWQSSCSCIRSLHREAFLNLRV
jgi:hypothetical protein